MNQANIFGIEEVEVTEPTTLSEWIAYHRVSMVCKSKGKEVRRWDPSPLCPRLRMEWDVWECTIGDDRGKMTVTMKMGEGHKGAQPEVYDVMYCIVSDSCAADTDFYDFCEEFGYDQQEQESLSEAKEVHKACKEQRAKLNLWLSDYQAYQALQSLDQD